MLLNNMLNIYTNESIFKWIYEINWVLKNSIQWPSLAGSILHAFELFYFTQLVRKQLTNYISSLKLLQETSLLNHQNFIAIAS